MSKVLIISVSTAFSLLFSVNVTAESECKIRADNKKANQYWVLTDSGEELGFTALEPDGSWFVWVKNEGAMNLTFTTQDSAKDGICLHGVEELF